MDPEQKERNNKAVRKSRAKKNKLLKEQRQINNELDAEINDLQVPNSSNTFRGNGIF